MAADLKALTSQTQKMEVEALLQLHGASEAFWAEAVERCEGRAKDRAQRNLLESQKATAILQEQLGDGPECSTAHKDAATLQDLARVALGERHWVDAATLFHKSEDMWDLAAERCSGTQKALAIKHQEQSELDGFNAEFCAPLFDRAREQTQKLRASAAGLSREEKQDGLMISETLWRNALAQCKGSAAQDSARNNAQTLARERGTPWVARNPAPVAVLAAAPAKVAAQPPKVVPLAPAQPTASKVQAATGLPNLNIPSTSTVAATSLAGAGTATSAAAAGTSGASALTGFFASASAALHQAVPMLATTTPQPENFTVGDMRFEGKFVRDADTPTYSGIGKLSWANGDVFDGTLVNGKRHGTGLFIWSNGQRYQGDWIDDMPTGQAVLDFANGDHYEGPVENASPLGLGSMRYDSGDSYKGSFTAGEPNGKGLYRWKNGQKFDGDWKGGKPNGEGKLQFANGDRYEGTVRNGAPSQTGTFTWANGDTYTGQWVDGRKNGQGKFTWTTGDRWEGTFENDQQTAAGTLIRKTP